MIHLLRKRLNYWYLLVTYNVKHHNINKFKCTLSNLQQTVLEHYVNLHVTRPTAMQPRIQTVTKKITENLSIQLN